MRTPAWYLLLVALLGILSKYESLRDLERFARRHHGALSQALGIELKRLTYQPFATFSCS